METLKLYKLNRETLRVLDSVLTVVAHDNKIKEVKSEEEWLKEGIAVECLEEVEIPIRINRGYVQVENESRIVLVKKIIEKDLDWSEEEAENIEYFINNFKSMTKVKEKVLEGLEDLTNMMRANYFNKIDPIGHADVLENFLNNSDLSEYLNLRDNGLKECTQSEEESNAG